MITLIAGKNAVELKCPKCGWSELVASYRLKLLSLHSILRTGDTMPVLGGEEFGAVGRIGPCGSHAFEEPDAEEGVRRTKT